ncbi:MAG: hypothetical protein SGPRY_002709, partial [Prymnesium sp.]
MQPAPAGAGGVAQLQLATWQMLAAFGASSRSPADLPAATLVHPLNIALSGGAWARVLNEYNSSGLLRTPMTSRLELRDALRTLT